MVTTKNITQRKILSDIHRAMHSIGYSRELIKSQYQYADCLSASRPVGEIPLVGFAHFPPDYRNACIGIIFSNGLSGEVNVVQHGALGAPLIFEITPSNVVPWKIEHDRDRQKATKVLNPIPFNKIESVFKRQKSEWKPESIFRAKGFCFEKSAYQSDFVDAGNMSFLEGIIHRKMDELLQGTISNVASFMRKKTEQSIDWQYIFQLLFRFVAAKVFRDRGHKGKWESDNALDALSGIEDHYADRRFTNEKELDRNLISMLWEAMLNSFHFQNLSVEDLAYIYENTFILKETRKEFGIHSTPSRVAEYIVRNLPFESIELTSRRVLEPCSGHSIFLVSAMRRLRELLPPDMPYKKRHEYLRKRLIGIETDPFACEVGRLNLTLADYPNPNGWKIFQEDVFITQKLDKEIKKADIILCNPPFEGFDKEQKKTYSNIKSPYKPVEVLRRVLDNPPELLGFVLPHKFTSGQSYKSFHKQLASIYGKVEIVGMPDDLFTHSDVDTVLLSAWDKDKHPGRVSVACGNVKKGEESSFFSRDRVPGFRQKTLDLVTDTKEFNLWIAPLSDVWDYLEDYPLLGNFTEIRYGIRWISKEELRERGFSRENMISDQPKKDFSKGHVLATKNLQQFKLKAKTTFLSLQPEFQYDSSYKYAWDKPKVVCNATRFQRKNPWRLAAVYDHEGLAFTKRFFSFWSNSNLNHHLILALLNSPMANAFIYTHDEGRDNNIETFKRLPIPELSNLKKEGVEEITKELLSFMEQPDGNKYFEKGKLKELLLRLDAAVLKAYDLPPKLERAALDFFQGHKRPVSCDFSGYYPSGFDAWLPLHEIISEKFRDSLAENVLNFEPIKDEKISAMLSLLMEDDL